MGKCNLCMKEMQHRYVKRHLLTCKEKHDDEKNEIPNAKCIVSKDLITLLSDSMSHKLKKSN